MNLTPDCDGYWKVDDDAANTTVVNEVGLDASLVGGENTEDKSQTGKLNKAFLLNGIDDAVNNPNNSIGAFGSSDFTICGWVRDDYPGGHGFFFSKREQNGTWTGYFFYWDFNSDKIRFGTVINNTWRIVTSTTYMVDHQWHFIMGIRENGVNRLYYDNVQEGGDITGAGGDIDVAVPLSLGAAHAEGDYYWKGYIDNMMIFDRALSKSERNFLWNNGNGQARLVSMPRPLAGGALTHGRKGMVAR